VLEEDGFGASAVRSPRDRREPFTHGARVRQTALRYGRLRPRHRRALAFVAATTTVVAVAHGAPPEPPEVALDRAPLSAKDLETKKEHAYVTGLPLAAFDPNFGFGFGARANVYWNGARDAPLFAYAPYDHACR
jgi:hypothetical protein